ncbi:MAG: divalent metal cation transporter [Patescibacteria group bacterium]|nr:divalent metal cation transporter [Patescibacteria group bacterium]
MSRIWRMLGPGFITGAADDDPSGIATYSQTGAQFGYGQLWMIPLLYPLMTAVQEACARIGAVTKKGIAAVIREHYSRRVLAVAVTLIAVANTVNIGANLGAMAESTRLLLPIPFTVVILFYTVVILFLEIFLAYPIYAKVLKWLAFSLFVYPATLFLIHAPWGEIIRATFIPHWEFGFGFIFILTGIIGTTISPYMFFWQASEEVEEIQDTQRTRLSQKFFNTLRIDNAIGMFLSQLIAWCIIVVTGTVLHQNGVTDIATAADAARALEPLVQTFPHSGLIAQLIFAIGIVGLGLLAIPILAGSAAYAMAEAFNWREGLSQKFRDAHGFYGIIIVAMILGLCINFIGIDPMKALIITSVINGIFAIPLLLLIAFIARSKKIMGVHRSGMLSNVLLWITILCIIFAAITMVVMFGT